MKLISILILTLLTACLRAQPQPPASLFDALTPPNSNPQTVEAILTVSAAPTQAGTLPQVNESDMLKTAGELYFFLQPRGAQAGGTIQLARASGICVFDIVNCPPLETIQVPFAFNFTINPLAWSPDGKNAVFAYSDNINGTPAKLWRFDPSTSAWTSLAEFAYIDPPFWSPDGALVALLVRDGLGGEDVYLIHPDGSGLKKIGTDLPSAARPYIMDGWFGDKVMMRSALTDNRVYLVTASDGSSRPMFDPPLIKNKFVAAPDASLLAYDEFEYGSPAHVLKAMRSDGISASALAGFTGGSGLYPIVWSNDSRLLAFTRYTDFNNGSPGAQVYLVTRDGFNLSLVYTGETVGRLIFSPNGKYLLVEETNSSSGGHLFLVDLETLEIKILQAPGLSTDYDWYAPSWKP